MTAPLDIAMLPFAKLMGVEVLLAQPDRVEGRLAVTPQVCTAGGILHGGAMMALADSLGAIGAFLSTPQNARTTTLESKTNFIGSARSGPPSPPSRRPCISAAAPASGRRGSRGKAASSSPSSPRPR